MQISIFDVSTRGSEKMNIFIAMLDEGEQEVQNIGTYATFAEAQDGCAELAAHWRQDGLPRPKNARFEIETWTLGGGRPDNQILYYYEDEYGRWRA